MSITYCISYYEGKESKPTVAFQVVVSHARFFMHVSKHFYGTWNDKLITINDTFPVEVWQGERFKHMRFVLINKNGVHIVYQGVWIAVDGGYQKVACFIDPMHNRYTFPEVVFSEWLESVRKDVECAFGILKIRFRFLRGFVIYQDADIIENAFKTAAMLHNMLLKWDGLDDFNWENINPDGVLEDDELVAPAAVNLVDALDVTAMPIPIVVNDQNEQYVQYRPGQYQLVREAIKEHFNHQYSLGLVSWPTRFEEKLKNRFPNQRSAIVARLNEEHERVLYVQASTLRGIHPLSNLPSILIGDGLFARIAFHTNDHIADYNGELITSEEAEIRNERGHGGYMIHVNRTTRLDCYNNCMNHRCKASKANSDRRAYNTATQMGALQNARMVVSTSRLGIVRVRLQATTNIPMHNEIITNYGNGFRYPIATIDVAAIGDAVDEDD